MGRFLIMTETSQLYQVPNPEEVDALLKGDFGVDEAAPQDLPGEGKVLEVGDRTGENSEVPEVGDRTGGNSEVLEVGDRKSTIDADRDMGYQKSVRAMYEEHARQLNEIGDLITELYLDLEYIKRVAKMLIQFAASQSPEAIRTVANLIDYQAAASLVQIQNHNETAHYPNVLIHRNERSTT